MVNTTPIIALSLVGQLDLLKHLYAEVMIPEAVRAEILAGGRRAGAAELEERTWIQVVPVDDLARAQLLSDLDRGEAEVIALAQERNVGLVLLDERLARRHAERLGLNVTGTLGVLLRAKRAGLISQVGPVARQLQAAGIWIQQDVVQRLLELAGE